MEWKGTHRALDRFASFARKVSRNHTRTAWVLKCDIRKFFASIDQRILLDIVARSIEDADVIWLLGQVVSSFETTPGKGLPLGNLTSQLLVNVYMNEFDQFVKHGLRVRHYLRYADDFVFLSRDRAALETLLPEVRRYLSDVLALDLHPDKVFIKTIASGVDFLGWVHFPDHRVLRTATKRRMLTRTAGRDADDPKIASYLGLLSHGNAHRLRERLMLS